MTNFLLSSRLIICNLLLTFAFSSTGFSQVTDFNPKTIIGGNGSILTITGTGFGTTRGADAYVQFPGFHPIRVLETDYVLWSNTEIRVKVPLGAGTGNPIVVVSPGLTYNLGYLIVAHLVTSDAFSPTHISAGTESILTITGTGFGPNKTANNFVEFLGGDAGQSVIRASGNDYVSWSDTKIEVKVPAGAGDGPLYITMDNGTMKTIHPWLIIDYNIQRKGGIDTKFSNSNGLGGYTFHLHSNMNSNNKAKAAFLNAFETWKCATGVNWVIGEPTNSRTGENVIRILDDDEADVGAIAQTTVSYTNYGSVWHINDIAITFSRHMDHYFKFSPSDPGLYDFQSVALHALGKGHNLGVVINSNDVMYWGRQVTAGEKRGLSANDLAAGDYMVNLSKISSGFEPPMSPLPLGACAPAYSYIYSFSPTTARAGEVVTITGTNFHGASKVSFGGVNAAAYTVVSPTTITAVVASGSASGDITVSAGGVAAAKGFTFISTLPQTLNYTLIPTKTFGDADFDLAVTASTGLPITYTSSNSSVATVTNNRVHIVGAGTATITASQAGNVTYSAANINLNLQVNKASQSINFDAIPGKLISDPDFNLNAIASSGLGVSYTNSNPTVATLVNSTVHILSTGTTTFTAVQNGNTNFNAAPSISITLTVSNLPQIMMFAEIANKKVNDIDFDPGATVNSGLLVVYTSSNTNVATIVNSKVHIVGAGSTIITASQEGNLTYAPISKTNILIVNKLDQTINFPAIIAKTYNDADFDPSATSGAGLAITYTSSNLNVATIVAGKVHIVGAGSTLITATQSGNTTYDAVSSSMNLTVNKLQQTISFPQITLKNHNDADFDLNATSNSGLPVSYSSSNTAVATIVGGKVHIVASGAAVITASQAGNANISAALDVAQNLDVVFNIPVSNFSIKSTDETCKTSNNGTINITATQILSYTASITANGATTTYPFNSVLAVNNLQAGTYSVCITVAGQPAYKQCFDLMVKEPKDLAVYSSIKNDGKNVLLKLEGSNRYTIELNGQVITTTDQEISLPLIKGNNIVKISSDKTCQGVITRTFLMSKDISIYPNPVKNVLNIATGSNEAVKIEIHALDGRLMQTSKHVPDYGQVSVDVSKLNKGLYVLTLSIGNSKTMHKVIKD